MNDLFLIVFYFIKWYLNFVELLIRHLNNALKLPVNYSQVIDEIRSESYAGEENYVKINNTIIAFS